MIKYFFLNIETFINLFLPHRYLSFLKMKFLAGKNLDVQSYAFLTFQLSQFIISIYQDNKLSELFSPRLSSCFGRFD